METIAKLAVEIEGKTEGLEKSLQGVQSKIGKLGGMITNAFAFAGGQAIFRGVEMLSGAVGGLADAMIGGNAEFERYETQFGVLLGSAEAAQARLEDLAHFGATTPFELPQVVQADKILQSFGLHAEDVAARFGRSGEQIRTIAGDVAAGTGAGFDEISGYLGKFSSGATGEAIARFQELGIVTRSELADMGLEFSKSGELLTPLDEAMTVVLQAMENKFGGMMDAQSSTFEGMISNLQDWKGQMLRTIGAPIFEVLKERLSGLLDFLNSPAVMNGIQRFAEMLADGIGRAIDFVSGLIERFGPTISRVFEVLPDIGKLLGRIFSGGDLDSFVSDIVGTLVGGVGPGSPVEGAISFLNGLFTRVRDGIQFVKDAFTTFIQALSGDWADSGAIQPLHRIIGAIGLVVNAFQEGGLAGAIEQLGPFIQTALEAVVAQVQQRLGMLVGLFQEYAPVVWQWLVDAIPPLLEAAGRAIGHLIEWVSGQLPGWVAAFQGWAQAAWAWLQDAIPPLLAKAGEMLGQLVGYVAEQLPGWIATLLEWGTQAVKWMADALPKLILAAGEFLGGLVDWAYQTALPAIVKFAADFARGMYEWVQDELIPKIGPEIDAFLEELKRLIGNVASSVVTAAKDIGGSIIDGVAQGITNAGGIIYDTIKAAIDQAIKDIKAAFGITSPSKVTAKLIGEPMGEGVMVGFANAISGRQMSAALLGALPAAGALPSPLAGPYAAGVGRYSSLDRSRHVTIAEGAIRIDGAGRNATAIATEVMGLITEALR